MIIETSMSPDWLSNTYLVADRPGGSAVLIDSGGPAAPILAAIERHDVTVTHLLCTHHHHDHVANNTLYRDTLGCRVCGHRDEREMFDALDVELSGGEAIETGGLSIRALHIPGHTVGQLAYIVNASGVFTGDTLFRGSVGGTRAPGHGTFAQLRHSVMEVLMKLPREMPVHPGHTDPTTVGWEWENNPFIRLWRGIEAPSPTPCMAGGKPAACMLRARDYDGGTKCWVRFAGDAGDEILPGSIVRDATGS